MKKTALGLIAGAFGVLAITGSRPAQAQEPTLAQIVKTGYGSTAALDPGATFLGPLNVFFKVASTTAQAKAAYAGDAGSSAYGWYDPSNNATLNQIAADTDTTLHGFSPSNPFGLYLKDNNSGTFYSQAFLNSDSAVHMEIYKGSAANTYYVGYEDRPNGSSDFDYNDLVVRYDGVALSPIPEPAFYQMGVFVMGGLMALRARRRNKK